MDPTSTEPATMEAKSYLGVFESWFNLTQYPPGLYRFLVDGYPGIFGHLHPENVRRMSWNRESWRIDNRMRTVTLLGDSYRARNLNMSTLMDRELRMGRFRGIGVLGDYRPVFGPGNEVVFKIDYVAAMIFGVPLHFVSMIAYRENDEGTKIWISCHKRGSAPGENMFRSTVEGALLHNKLPFASLMYWATRLTDISSRLIRWNTRYVETMNQMSFSGCKHHLLIVKRVFFYELQLGDEELRLKRDESKQVNTDLGLITLEEARRALGAGEFDARCARELVRFSIQRGAVNGGNEPNLDRIMRSMRRSLGVHAFEL